MSSWLMVEVNLKTLLRGTTYGVKDAPGTLLASQQACGREIMGAPARYSKVTPEEYYQTRGPHRIRKKLFEARTSVVSGSQEPNAGAERKGLDEATMLSSLELVLKRNGKKIQRKSQRNTK
jgi:hypothetical protein